MTATDWKQRFSQSILDSAAVQKLVAEHCVDDMVRAGELIAERLSAGGKLLLCGNGGSAADCQHMAAELMCRLSSDFERPAIAAIALTTDSSFMTAYSNDYSFAGVFARQVEGLASEKDVLIGVSTSGGSKNVLLAVAAAQKLGVKTIALMGEEGPLSKQVDVAIRIPSRVTARIQEAHIVVEHLLCELIERSISTEGST